MKSVYEHQSSSAFYPTRKRDYLHYFAGGALVLWGMFFIGKNGGFSDTEGVSNLLIGVIISCAGFVLSWGNSKHYLWLSLLFALLARLFLLPFDVGTDFERLVLDSALLSEKMNPFVEVVDSVTHSSEYGVVNLSGVGARSTPLMLWFLDGIGFSMDATIWSKFVLIGFDLLLCLLLGIRYGARPMTYYAWNPLAIFSVAGLANTDVFFLLPLAIGFFVWDRWVDKRGGASLINASGGIQGRLGRLVCFVAFLLGVSASLSLMVLPILLWLMITVIHRAGIRAGLVVIGAGLSPLILSYGWVSFSMKESVWAFMPYSFMGKAEALGLVPWLIEVFSSGAINGNLFGNAAIGAMVLYLVFTNDFMERFCNVYVAALIMLMPFVQPWHFLWITPFAVGIGHWGFRLSSIAAFVCYWPLRSELVELPVVDIGWGLRIYFWLPFVFGALWYLVKNPARSKGFYIRTY